MDEGAEEFRGDPTVCTNN